MAKLFAKTSFFLALGWILSLVMLNIGGVGPCGPTSIISGIGLWLAFLLTPAMLLSMAATGVVALVEISNGTLKRSDVDILPD
jgi:hypothetical protein